MKRTLQDIFLRRVSHSHPEDGMPLIKRKIFGCKYCPVLRDLPGNFLKAVESINKELFEIILRDVGQSVAELNDRPMKETLSQYRKHVNNLEKIREDQQAHIANLQTQLDCLSEKNKKHLKQIRILLILIGMMIIGLIGGIII